MGNDIAGPLISIRFRHLSFESKHPKGSLRNRIPVYQIHLFQSIICYPSYIPMKFCQWDEFVLLKVYGGYFPCELKNYWRRFDIDQ